jgi:hypothetical protein
MNYSFGKGHKFESGVVLEFSIDKIRFLRVVVYQEEGAPSEVVPAGEGSNRVVAPSEVADAVVAEAAY